MCLPFSVAYDYFVDGTVAFDVLSAVGSALVLLSFCYLTWSLHYTDDDNDDGGCGQPVVASGSELKASVDHDEDAILAPLLTCSKLH